VIQLLQELLRDRHFTLFGVFDLVAVSQLRSNLEEPVCGANMQEGCTAYARSLLVSRQLTPLELIFSVRRLAANSQNNKHLGGGYGRQPN
jgi:hypothetical protein